MIRDRANLSRKILTSNFRRLDNPYKLTFALTYWCNYKCKTCNIWERKPTDELSLEEIDHFFEQSNYFNWIDLTGGEVWLRKDFVDICESVIRHNKNLVLLHFPTNGYMTKQILAGVKEILKMKPPKFIVTVSLDGDEKVNDEVRGIEGGYKRQIETFKGLRKISGLEVVLGMTLSNLNAGLYWSTFEAVKKDVPDLRIEEMHLNVYHESEHYYGNEDIAKDDSYKKTILDELHQYMNLRKVRGPVSWLERRYQSNVEKYFDTGKTPVKCHSLKSSCFIDGWGYVYPCSMYDRKLGNLRDVDYDLKKIWDLEITQQTQKEIWKGDCPNCWTPCEAYQSILGNLL